MVYNSFLFIVFYPLIFLFYYLIPSRYHNGRNLFLLVVSYLLYLSWKPIYALILLGVTGITYITALLIERHRRRAKTVMTIGVVAGLIPLLFFKYFSFVNKTIWELLSVIGMRYELQGLNWAVPLGISFFTFQAIGYVWDVYYKRINAEKDILTYALFISFFPSILSGPINKASLVIPQIKKLREHFNYTKAVQGMRMILWGMFMKVVVADRVALFVDMVLPNYANYSGITCLLASICYTIQIYADFAGYSLMAIGVGKTLGFELTPNFCRPYFAVSVTDFWHRWHMSLSVWLKDYVYIPLGGSRCSKHRNYWNIFVTFIISGIWHGANWTFLVWGMFHGIFQIIEKAIGQQKCKYGLLGKSVKIVITFALVNFAWIFFRMNSLADAYNLFYKIFNLDMFIDLERPSATTILFVFVLFIKDFFDEFYPNRLKIFDNRNAYVRWSSYVVIILAILLEGVLGADNFIYADF